MKPVMVMWGNPVTGFKVTGPLIPNSLEIDYVTDVLLDRETWWYVPIIDAASMTREDV